MEVTGNIKVIEATQEVSSAFKKRNIVVTTDEQYPQHILVEFTQDKTSILDNYKEGENVKISINLRGREWTNPQGETKYFNSIQGWRIEKNNPSAVDNHQANKPPMPSKEAFEPAKEEEHDDLPF